jgi:hypothetical protein
MGLEWGERGEEREGERRERGRGEREGEEREDGGEGTQANRIDRTPESALEVVCVVAPFLVIGMGTRFIEMLALFLETWRQVSWIRGARWRAK